MLIKLYPTNTDHKKILEVVKILKSGGIVVFPTDTVYGLGCDITQQRAVEKVARLKGVKLEKAHFSFLFCDLSHISEYTKNIDNNIFRMIKKNIPGPFTFILEANTNIPKIFRSRKKTIGIRVPDNSIIQQILKELGNPILSTSMHDKDEILDYMTDPELIHERYENRVDVVIDGGYGGNLPSTVIDCMGDEPEIVRLGQFEPAD